MSSPADLRIMGQLPIGGRLEVAAPVSIQLPERAARGVDVSGGLLTSTLACTGSKLFKAGAVHGEQL